MFHSDIVAAAMEASPIVTRYPVEMSNLKYSSVAFAARKLPVPQISRHRLLSNVRAIKLDSHQPSVTILNFIREQSRVQWSSMLLL